MGTAAEKPQMQPPEPLYKQLPTATPFPMDALGRLAGNAAKTMHRVINAPDAICGQSVIAGMAQIAQGHADISIDGRRSPSSCFFGCVGDTGERKSAVDTVATHPHREYEKTLEIAFIDQLAEYNIDYAAWKAGCDAAKKVKGGRQEKAEALKANGDEPVKPREPVILIEEPTYEGLIKILQTGQPSVGLFTDEGGRFIGGHAMNAENALKTAAGISGLWDRGSAKRTRSADGHSSIHGKRISMHLMMQGIVAEMMLGNQIFREQGWLSRILFCWPESTVGMRPYVAENLFEDPTITAFHSRCRELLTRELVTNDRSELELPAFGLTSQAKRLWVPFHDYCDTQAADGGELDTVRGLANKAPEHATRLACVLSVFDGHTEISAEYLEAGIELVNFYLTEAIRMSDAGYITEEIKTAMALLDWMQQKRLHLVYPVMVYQHAPIRKLREKKTAMEAIELLVNHGWLIPEDSQPIDGKVRRQVWRLIHV